MVLRELDSRNEGDNEFHFISYYQATIILCCFSGTLPLGLLLRPIR